MDVIDHPPARAPRSSSRRARRLAATLLALGLLAAACSGSDDSGTDTIQLSQDEPDLAPDVSDVQADVPADARLDVPFATFEGGTRTLAEYSGQPLVLNFFAAWCPSCVSEMPDFEAVHQELGDEVAFIGMSQDFDPADALALVEATGVTYDLGWDPDLALYGEFGGFAMPTTVFVSADGEVVEVFAGALTADALRAKIAGIGA